MELEPVGQSKDESVQLAQLSGLPDTEWAGQVTQNFPDMAFLVGVVAMTATVVIVEYTDVVDPNIKSTFIAAPALQTTITGGVIGKISSFLFLGTGKTEGGVIGEIGSEPMLTFAWKPTDSDEMYVSGVPASKVIIRRREDANTESQVTTVSWFWQTIP